MRQIADNVYLVEGVRVSNVYMLVSGASLTLVDSGLRGEADSIAREVQQAGFSLNMLQNIILTHAHGDHIGGAWALARETGAHIIAHQDEVKYIVHTDTLPANSFLTRLLIRLSDRILLKQLHCEVDQPVYDGDQLDILDGLRVIHTPGHTPGSLSLFQGDRGILFCGDALFNMNPATRKIGLQLPSRFICSDNKKVRNSVHRLSQLPVEILCCGHGDPIFDNPVRKIKALLV